MPQILRRIPSDIYGGAVLTALKRSADMTVEEAIQYKVRAQALGPCQPDFCGVQHTQDAFSLQPS